MAFIDKGSVEDYLLISIDGSMDTRINEWIQAAQKYIEWYTQRNFEADSEVRYFDGPGGNILYVDDFSSIVTFKTLDLDGSTVDVTYETTDYFEYPLNSSPKHIIKLSPDGSYGSLPRGKKRIKIDAVWGYATTVPEDIKLVCTQLVSNIVNVGRQGGEDGVKQESLGDYSVTYGSLDEAAIKLGIKPILDSYKLLKV